MEPMVRDIATEMQIDVRAYSHGWVWKLTYGEKTGMIYGYKFSLNNAVAAAIASDKVATAALLADADIKAVDHQLVRLQPDGLFEWFGKVDSPFVVKPLDGTSGNGIKKCRDRAEAETWMRQYGGSAWAVSPFYDIVREVRVIMLDSSVLLAYEKRPVVRDGIKMFNLGCGATAVDTSIDERAREMVTATMQAVGLRVAAVDYIELADDSRHILEVNDGIMMENYLRTSAAYRDRSREVYRRIVAKMMEQ